MVASVAGARHMAPKSAKGDASPVKSSEAKRSQDIGEDTADVRRKSLAIGAVSGFTICAVLVVVALKLDLVTGQVVQPSSDAACPACISDCSAADSEVKELRATLSKFSTQNAEETDRFKAQQTAASNCQAQLASQDQVRKSSSDGVAAQLQDCKEQLQEAVTAASVAKAAAAAAFGAEATAAKASLAAAAAATQEWPKGDWPQCLNRDVALQGRAAEAALEDLTALFDDIVTGCRNGNCRATDTFSTTRSEDCAHACAALEKCSFWSHGDRQCFLRASSAGLERAAGFISAAKDCAPSPTNFSPKQAVLAVLDSELLRKCDGAVVSDACPDLQDGMRTWSYAINTLQMLLQGKEHNFANFIDQIGGDSDYFLSSSPANPAEMYAIAAANNRQVLDAIRSYLMESMDAGADNADISVLDVSVPRPVRGLVCRGPCMR